MVPEADLLVWDRSTRAILDALPNHVFVVDAQGLVVDANTRACAALGVQVAEMVGAPITRFVDWIGEDRNDIDIRTLLHPRVTNPVPCTFNTPNPLWPTAQVQTCPIAGSPEPLHWLVIIRDASAQTAHTTRVRETAKMEAVKDLATRIGNNFNNVLAAVSGRLETGLLAMDRDAQSAKPEFEAAVHDLQRAARLVRQLLRVSDPAPSARQRCDPATIVRACTDAIGHETDDAVTLAVELGHGSAHVLADAPQLVDVLVSLVYNARDSIAARHAPSGGHIRIQTSAVTTAEDHAIPPDLGANTFVRIDVADNGDGIPAEHLPRIFEPFYTTKDHTGAGLGLAGVYDMLKQHGGGITVHSTVGQGTTFHIYIPETTAPAASAAGTITKDGSETLLVVDDDMAVRKILRKALEHHGYRVLDAADGDEGIDVFDAHQHEIRLVILDVLMPRVSGWEVLENLKRRPNPPDVILQTGFTGRNAGSDDTTAEALLRKPYELTELVSTVRSVLDRARTGPSHSASSYPGP